MSPISQTRSQCSDFEIKTSDPSLQKTSPKEAKWFALSIMIIFQMTFFTNLNLNAANTNSYQYQAEGNLAYFDGNNPNARFERKFQISVSNAEWDVRITNCLPGFLYDQIVHLGSNIYYYTAFSVDKNSQAANNGAGGIESADVPVERGTFVSYIWLALASSYYFRSVTNNEVQPIWAKGSDVDKVQAHWELFDTPPFLPKYVAYTNKVSYLPPPFDSIGWKAGVFRVLSETNIGGLTLPHEFVYEYFKPKANAVKASDLELEFKVQVDVLSVRIPKTVSISPPLTQGATLIVEQRLPVLPHGHVVEYLMTNQAELPRAPEKAVVEQYNVVKQYLAAITAGKPLLKRTVQITFIVFITISSGVLIYFAIRKSKSMKKRQDYEKRH